MRRIHSIVLALAFALPAGASASPSSNPPPATWNPWGKESPEPYGYDVETAPDLPLGHVDPNDPPAMLTEPAFSVPAAAWQRAPLSVTVTLDRTSYSWFGRLRVTADVRLGGNPVTNCDSVVVVSAANPRVSGRLLDNGVTPDPVAGDGKYTGYFDVGAGEGEARPTGNYTASVAAYRGADFGTGASPTFALYSVRRWPGISTTDLPDPSDSYTDFFVTPNSPGPGFHHRIRGFGLVRSTSVANAQIRIPILPTLNGISSLSVTGSTVSSVQLAGNVIEFDCNLTAATVARVDIEFDAPSDLAALFIDRYQTGDIGLRDFRNGYQVWNRYIHTAVLGSGFSSPHGPGCIVDLHATDQVTGAAHTVDCMERVAVHLDNVAYDDGTGTYQSNIKWGGESLDWLEEADLASMTFRFHSGGNYGLANKVAVDRRVQFLAGCRYFRHDYGVKNIDAASHDFDFVWGREQWLYGSAAGSDRQQGDRGLLPADPTSYNAEYRFAAADLHGPWFAAFDVSSFYAIGVLVPGMSAAAMPTYVHFLCDAALGNFRGEYPIAPNSSCSDMENLFFEKALGQLAPGDSAAYSFYQWGGYAANRAALAALFDQDADAVAQDPAVVDGDGSGAAAFAHDSAHLGPIWPNPTAAGTEITFDLFRAGPTTLTLHDLQGRRLVTLIDSELAAGRYFLKWDGRDGSRNATANGVYFMTLSSGSSVLSRKLIVRR